MFKMVNIDGVKKYEDLQYISCSSIFGCCTFSCEYFLDVFDKNERKYRV